ncbi:hypothetical protein AGLY_016133 [Aphis glycines]|uniref:Uncharacterized protein n=1 Tax=Aphis glycines TaxID=307491 RepID=A0A6G0T0Y1_APHGL|nr:hypothetical protein AGLY_016133 [Aphis glycines]
MCENVKTICVTIRVSNCIMNISLNNILILVGIVTKIKFITKPWSVKYYNFYMITITFFNIIKLFVANTNKKKSYNNLYFLIKIHKLTISLMKNYIVMLHIWICDSMTTNNGLKFRKHNYYKLKKFFKAGPNLSPIYFIIVSEFNNNHSAGSTGNLNGPSVGVVEDAASISGSVVHGFFVTNVTSSGVELSGEPCLYTRSKHLKQDLINFCSMIDPLTEFLYNPKTHLFSQFLALIAWEVQII